MGAVKDMMIADQQEMERKYAEEDYEDYSEDEIEEDDTSDKDVLEQPEPVNCLRVFLCHASEDKSAVRRLYKCLKNSSFVEPWLDEEELLPGQDWHFEISKAVRDSDVVILCLSRRAINKRGYVQREIRYALDIANEQPEGAIFLIPVKLERCTPPEKLRHVQWVDLFDDTGYGKLIKALRHRARDLDLIDE